MAKTGSKTKAIAEFGDFQTPLALAMEATQALKRIGVRPRSILEPTCGRGSFVAAAAACFPEAERIVGVDINRDHLIEAKKGADGDSRIELRSGNFFEFEWEDLLAAGDRPWLIIGNPPWVTSAELGTLGSANLPEKSNFQGRAGIDAITGKGNFDISEWMLLRYLAWLKNDGVIAVLCKTAVARKLLLNVWKQRLPVSSARIYRTDAVAHFGASVDACFFVLELREDVARSGRCEVYDSLNASEPSSSIGFVQGHVISDIDAFSKYQDLLGSDRHYVWRSGIKHDCSKVMELKTRGAELENGFGELVDLEKCLLYPMLKSSDVGNGRGECRGRMLVTQEFVGQETEYIRSRAPKTWRYLERHAPHLDKRASSIYRSKPRFAIFGVGPYSFAPWKVAISGFYKRLQFLKIGPVDGKAVVVDDTVYFLPCWSEEEATFIEEMLQSRAATAFLGSMIHWDDKRPITADVLKRLDIAKLAGLLGRADDYKRFTNPSELQLRMCASNS